MGLYNITIGDYLKNTCRKFPNDIAIQSLKMHKNISWSELDKITDDIAKGMIALGLKKGDHLVLWGSNKKEWIYIFLASSKIGVCTVTLNTNYVLDEVEKILAMADAKAIAFMEEFYNTSYIDIIEKIKERYNKGISKIPQLMKHFIYFGDKKRPEYTNIDDLISLGKNIKEEDFKLICNKVKPDEVVNIQFTSGTTSAPKGVMLTHYSLVNTSYITGNSLDITHKDKLCLVVPFFHCFGLSAGILLCIGSGCSMVLVESYKIDPLVNSVKQFKCTVLHGVPTMFCRVLENSNVNMKDFSSVRTGLIAGAAVSKKLLDGILEKMNIKDIQVAYGQTETSPGCTQTTKADSVDKKYTTVGKSLPYVEMKIFDTVSKKEVTVNNVGEICVRGFNLMKGYYKNQQLTNKTIDEDGWLHTGDLGFIDKEGYYHITGRIQDVIIRGGENINPKEIRENLLLHPEVQKAEIIGIPDQRYGEEIAACIILKENSSLNKEDIKKYMSERLAHYKVPKYIKFYNEFPLTDTGKVKKCELKNNFKN
ncbi:AMP-binding protein [Clostridium niameyense]|uniref:AMP-binding protein n=1 Tax=Clostridium niameyense TaxID=1622073 RepID=UPI00067EA820|nr:AMP-binding protein [Clostridium niameyense]